MKTSRKKKKLGALSRRTQRQGKTDEEIYSCATLTRLALHSTHTVQHTPNPCRMPAERACTHLERQHSTADKF